MPNGENLLHLGKGAASTFWPLKSSEKIAWKLCPPDRGTYCNGVLGVKPDSDETHTVKAMTNAGRRHEAGLVIRCHGCHRGVLNSCVWECGLSRSSRKGSGRAARQWRDRSGVYGWCRTHNRNERADGQFLDSELET